MGRIIRTCNLGVAALALVASSSVAIAAKETPQEQIVANYVSARLAEMGNRDQEALKTYLKLHKLAPDSETLSDRLFTSAIRAGDMQSAVRAVRALELKKSSNVEGPLLLFVDAFKARNWPLAGLAADQLESEGSNLAFMAQIMRAWLDVAQGKPSSLSVGDPKDQPVLAYYSVDQRVYLNIAAGNYATAKPYLRGFALNDVEFGKDLLIRAAPVYAALGDGDFAQSMMKSVAEADYATALARVTARDPQARLSAEEGLAMLFSRIAGTMVEQNNSEQGLVFARIAEWLAPANAGVQLGLANAMEAQGLRGSADSIRAAIAPSSPYWPRAVADRLAQYADEGRLDDAVKLAGEARRLKPASPDIAVLQARYLGTAGNHVDAIAGFQKLVADADNARLNNTARAYYRLMLGTELDNSGDWPAARKVLEEAVALDPKNPSILNYLGYALVERGQDIATASDLIQRAYNLNPQSVAITDSMGWAKFQQKQYPEAIGYLEKAARVAGADATINEHLGDAYWQAGRKIEARYAWRVAAHGADEANSARLAMKLDFGLPDTASSQ